VPDSIRSTPDIGNDEIQTFDRGETNIDYKKEYLWIQRASAKERHEQHTGARITDGVDTDGLVSERHTLNKGGEVAQGRRL
jgi:hypothetical protein